MCAYNRLKKSLLFMVVLSVLILSVYSIMNKKVILTVNGQIVKFNTMSRTVESFLINENINIEEGCRITPDLDTKIKSNLKIKVINPYEVKISDGNEELVYKTNQETVGDIFQQFNIELNSKDIINKKLDDSVKANEEIIITRVEEEVTTEVTEIPYEVEYIDDISLVEGQTKQHIKGKNGKLEIKYKITYKNGVPIVKEKVSENMLIKPIKEIIKKGKLKASSI